MPDDKKYSSFKNFQNMFPEGFKIKTIFTASKLICSKFQAFFGFPLRTAWTEHKQENSQGVKLASGERGNYSHDVTSVKAEKLLA